MPSKVYKDIGLGIQGAGGGCVCVAGCGVGVRVGMQEDMASLVLNSLVWNFHSFGLKLITQ